ncbi:phosphoglucomutase/phosphomannomutase [Pyrococcus sp. NA2]|nr:phosphoglucomutase/phosphomannomutase [Pyrococcus sp. NA2]
MNISVLISGLVSLLAAITRASTLVSLKNAGFIAPNPCPSSISFLTGGVLASSTVYVILMIFLPLGILTVGSAPFGPTTTIAVPVSTTVTLPNSRIAWVTPWG